MSEPALIDSNERKRKERNRKDRERYANMSDEQKKEKSLRSIEYRKRRKAELSAKDQKNTQDTMMQSKELSPHLDEGQLKQNDFSGHNILDGTMIDQKNTQDTMMQSKEFSPHLDEGQLKQNDFSGHNIFDGTMIDNKCDHDTLEEKSIIDSSDYRRQTKRMRENVRYANLSADQKKARNRRLYVQSSKRRSSISAEDAKIHRETKWIQEKVRRHTKKKTLNKESIALENPMYVPDDITKSDNVVEIPNSNEFGMDVDMNIPHVIGRPIYLLPSPNNTEVKTIKIQHSKNVSNGERQALLQHRNKIFESSAVKKINVSTMDMTNSEIRYDDGLDSAKESVANNNGDEEGVVFEVDSDEEDDFLFVEQEEVINNYCDVEEEHGDTDPTSKEPDPYDVVYSNLVDTNMLNPQDNCKYCNAKKFQYEPKGFCCREGKITLSNSDTPPELMRLWTSADADARHFRDNIRFFNGHFSFTSLYCKLDSDTTNLNKHPIYTFRAHGQMYHNIRSFGKQDGLEPNHLELYFYDDDPSLDYRYHKCRNDLEELDKEVISRLVSIMKGNPYSEQLRNMGGVENIEDYCISLNLDQRLDQRVYNAPISSEVAAVWIEGNERRKQFENSVVLQGKNRKIYGIQSHHGCYDPLSYPLFFPKGELGWHTDIPRNNTNYEKLLAKCAARKARGENVDKNDKDNADGDDSGSKGSRQSVSIGEYYCYKFQICPGIFNPILYGKRLFQQFAVDTYIKIENSRLDYIRNNQASLRSELYQGLVDSIHAGEVRANAIGKRTVLCTSFIGGRRDKRRRYMDAMALVAKYGKPDIFLTMTCNPSWPEITSELYHGQVPTDRPDLIVRVFRAKLEELKKQLLDKDILGKVKAFMYVVEFQKRGLPHAHFLLIMEGKFKLTCPEQYDRLISAELSDKNKYPELYKMVVKHMMHGPCGKLNPNCPCTKNRSDCKNFYPRPFNAATLQGKDSYPLYRRRDDGRKVMVRKHMLDNRWVVPYNPRLLQYLNCHINVEACSSIKAVKYLFKYIYKGHDKASVTVNEAGKAVNNEDINDIKQYRDARWITPPEALWRIYGFDLSKNSPPVLQLHLHLPNMHMVCYTENQDITQVVNSENASRSMLTEYFDANKKYVEARNVLYKDFPEKFSWQKGGKIWKLRGQKRKKVNRTKHVDKIKQVGRIVSAHPAEGERYYLRIILNHIPGATSFIDLRTVGNSSIIS